MTDSNIDGTVAMERIDEWFPEVYEIDDSDIRSQTVQALSRIVPEYFWEAPVTNGAYYHHPHCRGKYGLYLHTKMAFTAYERLVDSELQSTNIDNFEADCGRAAVLLHDTLRYGHEYEAGDSPDSNSAKLAAKWLSAHTDLPNEVVRCVRRIDGPFGVGYERPLERLCHQADMLASNKNISVGVYQPPESVAKDKPHLPRAQL